MAMKAKELAQLLSVSPATISLVLNNKPGISDSLRQSLTEKIKELGCADMLTKEASTSLQADDQTGRVRTGIAYLIYSDGEENSERFAFYPAVLEGAETQARESGHNLMVYHVSPQGAPQLKTMLEDAGVIGAIIQATHITPEIQADLHRITLPCVFIDAYRPELNRSSVCVNNEQGIYSAVRYLKEAGHRNLGYILSGRESDSDVERRRCFHQALREYGLADRREFYYSADGRGDQTAETMKRIWQGADKIPTAIVCENDIIAFYAVRALNQCGYQVPQDVSLIGFDDRSICTMSDPKLTTLRSFRNLLGREAVKLLKNKLELKKLGISELPIKIELPTELVIRDSVRNILQ